MEIIRTERCSQRKESINKTTVADIKKYYEGNFGAARAHLYVAGRFRRRRNEKGSGNGIRGME